MKEIRGLDQGDASDSVTTLPVAATGAAAALPALSLAEAKVSSIEAHGMEWISELNAGEREVPVSSATNHEE